MSKVESQKDLSFPTITKMPPHLSESRPMSRFFATKKRLNLVTRSLSADNLLDYGRQTRLDHMGIEKEAEEKMDLLWENFNEEISTSRTHFIEADDKSNSTRSMKLPNANVLMLSSRRKSVAAVMSVLRKICLIHNYQHSVNKL
ncbi:hypothetical protein LIER_20105 [Lithospermum erythrorhizon]|uniref:Uncharacterized protein n=1 Tax=Lithospermum erythrorhizon TaxID=34254 RepID=A0AAV3QL77_LITER